MNKFEGVPDKQPADFEREFVDFEQEIASVQSFPELYAILEDARVIEGSKETYTAEEIKASIETMLKDARICRLEGKEMEPAARRPMIQNITKAHGIRKKVIELLDKEDVIPVSEQSSEMEMEDKDFQFKVDSSQGFEELYAVIEEAQVFEGSRKTYTAAEFRSAVDSIRKEIRGGSSIGQLPASDFCS